ncbi:hypothetical protein Acr_05g0012100 [Actinidia rufa]|uniref:Uncharacterized protein n=1 Tax=Actinidia rufa TaxID=165716 RepID=A0A7J0EM71_9ERIC|nr:hypothetical protein Acr_05g0012100 [Actinidia rufa]
MVYKICFPFTDPELEVELSRRLGAWSSLRGDLLHPASSPSTLGARLDDRDSYEEELISRRGGTWRSTSSPPSCSTSTMVVLGMVVAQAMKAVRSLNIGNGRCGWRWWIGRGEELYQAGVILIHDSHLLGHTMYLAVEPFLGPKLDWY